MKYPVCRGALAPDIPDGQVSRNPLALNATIPALFPDA